MYIRLEMTPFSAMLEAFCIVVYTSFSQCFDVHVPNEMEAMLYPWLPPVVDLWKAPCNSRVSVQQQT